jgi:AraC-like DNA-binding protein
VSASTYQYSECEAHSSLSPWILGYWSFRLVGEPSTDSPFTVWPDGCLSIACIPHPIPGPRILATGPRVTAMQPPLRANSFLIGLRLWPDAIQSVTGLGARSLRDAVGPALPALVEQFTALLPGLAQLRSLEEAKPALDAVLLPMSARWAAADEAVRRAVRFIVAERGEVDMSAVAADAGLGLRQLQRRFLERTALTMREWARVRRLRESLALKLRGAAGWSSVAASAGFADHAHLTREFVTLTGMAPTSAARMLERVEHLNVRP